MDQEIATQYRGKNAITQPSSQIPGYATAPQSYPAWNS